MKKLILFITSIYCVILLSGCGIFDKEYSEIGEYSFPTQNSSEKDANSGSVSNFSELKNAIISMVDRGEEAGQIVVSELYIGDINEDVSNAIWQVRSQDALCAYCVKNMTYDLTTIVTYTEVNLYITYSKIGIPFRDIHKLQYSTDLKEIIETAINNLDKKLVILVNRSSYSSQDMKKVISNSYQQNPLICPLEPEANVTMFSGTNGQRLYEIDFRYKVDDQTLKNRKGELDNITLFSEEEMNQSEYDKAMTVFTRMTEVVAGSGNTVYDSLVMKQADSEGVAIGFVALCKEIGINALCVYGQYNQEDFCWNMVRINGNYYHVCINDDDPIMFKTDVQMWGLYRWNIDDYPTADISLAID